MMRKFCCLTCHESFSAAGLSKDKRSTKGRVKPALYFFAARFSAAGALEFFHETGKRLDGFNGDGVVKRNTHSAHGAVAGCSDQACGLGFLGEILLDGLVTARDAENHVHFRA